MYPLPPLPLPLFEGESTLMSVLIAFQKGGKHTHYQNPPFKSYSSGEYVRMEAPGRLLKINHLTPGGNYVLMDVQQKQQTELFYVVY